MRQFVVLVLVGLVASSLAKDKKEVKDEKPKDEKPKRSTLLGDFGTASFYGNHLTGAGFGLGYGHGGLYNDYHFGNLGHGGLYNDYHYGNLGHEVVVGNGLSHGAVIGGGNSVIVGGTGGSVAPVITSYGSGAALGATGVTVGAARTVGVHTQSHTNVLRKITEEVPVGVPQPYPVTVTRTVPVPQPYTVTVPRPVAVPVHVKVPVEVPRPYAVKTPHPVPYQVRVNVPVEVPRPYPVTVTRTVQVPVARPYAVPEPHPVPVAVPHPVPVSVAQPYPVHVPTPVVVKEPRVVDGGVSHHHVNTDVHLHGVVNGHVTGAEHDIYGNHGFGSVYGNHGFGSVYGNNEFGSAYGYGHNLVDSAALTSHYGLNGNVGTYYRTY